MATIYAPHKIDRQSDHYREVKEYMMAHGSPVIRVVEDGDRYLAIEGSHRLAVAYDLGITPIIVTVDEMDPLSDIDHDFDLGDIYNGCDNNNIDSLADLEVSHLIQYLYDRPEVAYSYPEEA
jgi:hypothetical protein